MWHIGAAAALLGLMIAPVLTASAASAAPLGGGGGGSYVCTGGNVPPGSYWVGSRHRHLFVPRARSASAGNSPSRPEPCSTPSPPVIRQRHPVVPATVRIGGNVLSARAASWCSAAHQTSPVGARLASASTRSSGNLTALGSQAVVVHSATIGGNVTMLGGGGGAAGGADSNGCFNPKPSRFRRRGPKLPVCRGWWLDSTRRPRTLRSAVISPIVGQQTCWMGSLRNQVRGSLTYAGDVTSDADGMEINNNLMGGNMTCLKNDPAVQYGDTGAAPNLVGGLGIGECGFNVTLPNTGGTEQATVLEHISVSLRSLKIYYGTHTATFVTQAESVKTTSGYTITAVLNDFTLKGTGLTGSGKATPSTLPAPSGDAVLSTVHPDGSELIIAYDSCDSCSFGGQTRHDDYSGSTGQRAARGLTFGTFLVYGRRNRALSDCRPWLAGERSPAPVPIACTWSLIEHLKEHVKPHGWTASQAPCSQATVGMSGVPRNSGHSPSVGQ